MLDKINETVQNGMTSDMEKTIKEALECGIESKDILEGALLPAMGKISEGFKKNELYVPEVIVAARAFNRAVDLLKPFLVDAAVPKIGKAVIGTVKGDVHDIGKNLVKMMLIGKGIEVIDLGVDVSADQFVEAVKEHSPQVVMLSALLTMTMMYQGTIINALIDAGLRDSVKIVVGGAPVTSSFAKVIGADAYADDAAASADLAYEYIMAGKQNKEQ